LAAAAFFFSSRRRHTRFSRDWSSDVCSSDLTTWEDLVTIGGKIRDEQGVQLGIGLAQELDSNMAHRAILYSFDSMLQDVNSNIRSEERRVGKEGRSRGRPKARNKRQRVSNA